MLNEPEAHERIISAFRDEMPTAVATFGFAELELEYQEVKQNIREKGPMVVIPEFELVSKLIGGFDPERITFLLAKSGYGKSVMAMTLALAAAKRMAVGYMNLEMGLKDIAKRVAVMRSKGNTWANLHANQIESLGEAPRFEFRISDGQELHVENIIAWARAYKRMNPSFGLLVIDYDQKMEVDTSRDTPEWKALHKAVRELETVSKVLKIHVIIVAQFNRQGEIAASFRTLNSAHSVLRFRDHDGGAIIENSIKSRHAEYPCAVRLNYDRSASLISESKAEGVFSFKDEEPEERRNKTIKSAENKYSKMYGSRYGGD